MKTITLIFSMLISLSSCSDGNNTDCNDANAYYSDDSTNKQETSIIGTWQLIETKFCGNTNVSNSPVGTLYRCDSIYYCDENITYTFEPNGVLKVNGKDNAGYSSGTYKYEFGESSISSDEPRLLVVKTIGISKWTYSLNNEIMKLDSKPYVDGLELYFKRK